MSYGSRVQCQGSRYDDDPGTKTDDFETRRMPGEGCDFSVFKEIREKDRDRMKGDGNSQVSRRGELEERADFSPRTLAKLVHRERNRGHHSPANEAQRHSGDNGTPPSSEPGMITPPHLRWAQNLQSLLNDKEGVEVFERFLTQEGFGLHDLKFWFACQGLKNYDPGSKNIHQVIKVIYKKYVKTCLVMLNSVTRQDIADKINSRNGMDQTIFDRAQRELEEKTLQHVYLNFLKSDAYLQHVQKMQLDDDDDGDEDADRFAYLSGKDTTVSNFLPTLHEDKEFGVESARNLAYAQFSQRDNRHLRYCNNRLADALRYNHPEAQSYQGRRSSSNSSHLKYAGYLPASAQDSELQSLSSDAQTDDTLSVTTDGSDCYPTYSCRSQGKKQQRAIKRNASLNKDPMTRHNFIPRTQRIPPERLVEKHPDQFAAILIEKLSKVKKDIDGYAKLDESLRLIETDDLKVPAPFHCQTTSSSGEPAPSSSCALERLTTKLPPQLLFSNAVMAVVAAEENDQSILDQHVSRVWNDSTCQSPLSKTPGQQSPPLLFRPTAPTPQQNTERRRMASPAAPPIAHWFPPPRPGHLPDPYSHARVPPVFNANRLHRERDACSSDSGTVRDYTPECETEGFQFHAHKRVAANVSAEEGARRNKEGSRRSGAVKKSTNPGTDSSSCVDSGVSVCDPPSSVPNHERVYSWVLDNEKYSYTRGSDSDKDSTRHRKSSHSSLSTQSSAPAKQSHSKKAGSHVSRGGSSSDYPLSRSLQQDSSLTGVSAAASLPQSSGYPQPGQPVAADPFMPILPPPNTTTQLFEAKRRLEDEAAKGKLPKPKTLSASSGKEKYEIQKSRQQPSFDDSFRKTGKRLSTSNSQSLNAANNNATTASLTSCSSSFSNEMTVIGYVFTGEAVPYRTKLSGKNITLKQFKSLLSKKGNYRYFFKRSNNEFGTGVVNEEVSDDNEVLPLWEGKIFCTIETVSE